MSARVKLPEPLDELLRSELEAAIHEVALHRDDELIAKRRIIDKWGQIDVAAELGWDRSTVSDHEKYIFQRVEAVAKQLYTKREPGINPSSLIFMYAFLLIDIRMCCYLHGHRHTIECCRSGPSRIRTA